MNLYVVECCCFMITQQSLTLGCWVCWVHSTWYFGMDSAWHVGQTGTDMFHHNIQHINPKGNCGACHPQADNFLWQLTIFWAVCVLLNNNRTVTLRGVYPGPLSTLSFPSPWPWEVWTRRSPGCQVRNMGFSGHTEESLPLLSARVMVGFNSRQQCSNSPSFPL